MLEEDTVWKCVFNLVYVHDNSKGKDRGLKNQGYMITSCRTATLDFFFDLAESKVAVFLCSILTSDGIPFCFGKNSFL